MHEKEIFLTIKAPSGSTWSNAEFELNDKVGEVLEKAVEELGLDRSPAVPYQLLLVTGSTQRALRDHATLRSQGVVTGSVLLISGGGPAIDG